MARVTILGGAGEIGGNKILVEDRDARIIFDFGMSISERSRYFSDPYASPRHPDSLLRLGIIPPLEGAYLWQKEPRLDAVVLSHAHLDHYGYLSMLHREIPVHCGETTVNIMRAVTETRRASFESDYRGLEYRPFRTGSRMRFGSVSIRPVHVDHSVPGAYGFVIETSSGAIVYTGDLRSHGRMASLTADFARAAAACGASLLLTEATNVVGGAVSSEEEVSSKLARVIATSTGLVMASYSAMDTDRLVSFYDAARGAGRRLAVSARQAYLLLKLEGDGRLRLPRLSDEALVVYRRRKKRYDRWEEEVSSRATVVTAQEIAREQRRYVFGASLADMEGMIEVRPDPGSVYLLSSSEPYNEEMELDMQRLVQWLDHYGMPLYHIHVSGHIMPQDLKKLVEEIGPRRIVPIHTEHPELFARYVLGDAQRATIPRRNEPIETQ